MAIAYDVTFFARLSGFCVAAICGNIQSRFTFLMMIVKEEDGTVKSLCVGTQGWLSHKMLPLPGKRVVWCAAICCSLGTTWCACAIIMNLIQDKSIESMMQRDSVLYEEEEKVEV